MHDLLYVCVDVLAAPATKQYDSIARLFDISLKDVSNTLKQQMYL